MNYYNQLNSKDKEMIQNTLRCYVRTLKQDKKNYIEQYQKLSNFKKKLYGKPHFEWYSHQAHYLDMLANYMDVKTYMPDTKALTNMWIYLKMNQKSLRFMANYNAKPTLQLLMNQLKIIDSGQQSNSTIDTHLNDKSSSNKKNKHNIQQSSINNYILKFIQTHINNLNLHQIMRGISKWSKQNYSRSTYFNKLLPQHMNVLSMNYLKKSCQQAIQKTMKHNHINESVKITKTLNGIKKFHSDYFVLINDNLLPLDKSLCLKIINDLLTNNN